MNKKFFDYTVTARGSLVDEEKIREALETFGFENVSVEHLLNFDAFIDSLPEDDVAGCKEACLSHIEKIEREKIGEDIVRTLKEACDRTEGDSPRNLAQAMFGAINGYCATSYKAAAIVADCMSEALKE